MCSLLINFIYISLSPFYSCWLRKIINFVSMLRFLNYDSSPILILSILTHQIPPMEKKKNTGSSFYETYIDTPLNIS